MNPSKFKTVRVAGAPTQMKWRSARVAKRMRALGVKVRALARSEMGRIKIQRAGDLVISASITAAAGACFDAATRIEAVSKLKGAEQ